MNGRVYDPEIGRFTSADPTNGSGLNRYSYVNNNPMTFTDPSGFGADDPVQHLGTISATKPPCYPHCAQQAKHHPTMGVYAAQLFMLRVSLGDGATRVLENKMRARVALKKRIQKLESTDILSESEFFKSANKAAISVLDILAPLSAEYSLELYGSLKHDYRGWYYTLPSIGTNRHAFPDPNYPAYHTHPFGDLHFSNIMTPGDGRNGNDANWVKQTKESLYVGTQLQNGRIGVAVCRPGNCSLVGYGGTPGKVLQ